MLKKNIIILGSDDYHLKHVCDVLKNHNLILISDNIFFLEKFKNVKTFPLLGTVCEFKMFADILKKKFSKIDVLIINMYNPFHTMPFEKIEYKTWKHNVNKNISDIFLLMKYLFFLLKRSNKPEIIITIHRNASNIKAYWSIIESVNGMLVSFMKSIKEEYKNINDIKINYVSSENVVRIYKKNIYPYKNEKRSINKIFETYKYIITSDIRNLMIKV